MACFPRNRLCASVVFLKFASTCGTVLCELQNLKDTSNLIIPVGFGFGMRVCRWIVGTSKSTTLDHDAIRLKPDHVLNV